MGESDEPGKSGDSITRRPDSLETIQQSPINPVRVEHDDATLKSFMKCMLFDGAAETQWPSNSIPESAQMWIAKYIECKYEPAKFVQVSNQELELFNARAAKGLEKMEMAMVCAKEIRGLEESRNSAVSGILDAVRKKQSQADSDQRLSDARRASVKKQLEDWGSNKLKQMDVYIDKQKNSCATQIDQACEAVLQLYRMVDSMAVAQGSSDQSGPEFDLIKELEYDLAALDLCSSPTLAPALAPLEEHKSDKFLKAGCL